MSFLIAVRERRHKARGKTFLQMLRAFWGRAMHWTTVSVNTAYHRAKYRRVDFGPGTSVKGRLVITGPGRVMVGAGCAFDTAGGKPNKIMTYAQGASVIIGNNCFLNSIEIACLDTVEVGQRAMIGDCLLMDTDFHSVEINRWSPDAIVKSKPIHIADNVWIANRTVILKGVTIGANSVVGAGTVVRRSVPANVVVAGNPQQIVKNLDTNIEAYKPTV